MLALCADLRWVRHPWAGAADGLCQAVGDYPVEVGEQVAAGTTFLESRKEHLQPDEHNSKGAQDLPAFTSQPLNGGGQVMKAATLFGYPALG